MKKIICLLLVVAFVCSGCALAAGMVAGGIASEVIKRTTGIGKDKEKKEAPKFQELLRDNNVQEIR